MRRPGQSETSARDSRDRQGGSRLHLWQRGCGGGTQSPGTAAAAVWSHVQGASIQRFQRRRPQPSLEERIVCIESRSLSTAATTAGPMSRAPAVIASSDAVTRPRPGGTLAAGCQKWHNHGSLPCKQAPSCPCRRCNRWRWQLQNLPQVCVGNARPADMHRKSDFTIKAYMESGPQIGIGTKGFTEWETAHLERAGCGGQRPALLVGDRRRQVLGPVLRNRTVRWVH